MSNRTPTPSVLSSVQQSWSRQISPYHDVVKPTYFWLTTTSRPLSKPCHHGVFNAVLGCLITWPKYWSLRDLTWLSSCLSVFACMYLCSVVISFVQEICNNFLMHLISKSWIYCYSVLFNVHASHPCVAIGQTDAFISRNLVAVQTDIFRHIFVNLFITTMRIANLHFTAPAHSASFLTVLLTWCIYGTCMIQWKGEIMNSWKI